MTSSAPKGEVREKDAKVNAKTSLKQWDPQVTWVRWSLDPDLDDLAPLPRKPAKEIPPVRPVRRKKRKTAKRTQRDSHQHSSSHREGNSASADTGNVIAVPKESRVVQTRDSGRDDATQTPRTTGVQTSLPNSEDEDTAYYSSDDPTSYVAGNDTEDAPAPEPRNSQFMNQLLELEKAPAEVARRPLSPPEQHESVRKITAGAGDHSSAASATPARIRVQMSEEELLAATLKLQQTDAAIEKARFEQKKIVIFLTCSPDMEGIVDEIARQAWPAINKHCKARGDLSFAVEILPHVVPEPLSVSPGSQILRLQTLGRCSPFFVAVVGDDYGETVERPDRSLVEFYPWLKGRRDVSLFDMEISYAKQQQSLTGSPAGLAYIVHSPIRGINEPKPRGMREMSALKESVRTSRLRVFEVQSQQAVIQQLASDVCTAIDYEFPSVMMIRKLSATDIQRNLHAGFLRNEAEVATEVVRPDVQQVLTAYLNSKKPNLSPVVLTSDFPQSGTTRLLTNWINNTRHFRKRKEDGVFIFTHFAGLTASTSNNAEIISRLARGLREFLNEDLSVDSMDINVNVQEILSLFQIIHRSGNTAIVVIDGLQSVDTAAQGTGALPNASPAMLSEASQLAWIPQMIPDSIKLILSIGNDAGMQFEVKKRHWETISLPCLVPEEAAAICSSLQRQPGGKLADDAVRLLLLSLEANPSTRSNPLYLHVATALIRDPRRTIAIEKIIQLNEVSALYDLVLDALQSRAPESHPNLTADILGLLHLSVHGLTIIEILHVVGVPRSVFESHFSAFGQIIFQAVDDSKCSPPESRRFVVAHRLLREAIQRRYLANSSLTQRARFMAIEQFEGFIGPGRLTSLPTIEELITASKDGDFARNADELAWALIREEAWEHVVTLIGNIAVFQTLWSSDLRRNVYTIWQSLRKHVDPLDSYWDKIIDLYWSATDASGKKQDFTRILPLARVASALGELFLLLDNPASVKLLTLAVELYRKFLNTDQHQDVARVYFMLGLVHQKDKNKYTDAIEAFEKSYNIYARTIGNHIAAANAVISLGEVLISSNRLNEALEALRLAKKMLEDLGVADFHPEAARCYNNLGLVAKKTGQLTAAEAYYAKSLAIRKETYGENHPHTALSYRNIGSLAFAMGKKEDAVQSFKKALDIGNNVHGPMHLSNASTHEWLSGVLQDMGNETEGKVHAATAAYIREKAAKLADDARHRAADASRQKSLESTPPSALDLPRPGAK